LVELAGRPDVPVARGAEKPLVRTYGGGWEGHGHNGLGDVEFPPPQGRPDARRAAQFIVETVMANLGEITLVPLGPLTNIALAVSLEPRIAQNVKEVVLMGGAATVPGNASPVAEANIRNDPEAAAIVFHAGWPVTMVGLDVTHKTVMTAAYMERLKGAGNRFTEFIYAITRQYMRANQQAWGDRFPVHDPSALSYVIDPTLFKTQRLFIDVEYHSPYHQGQTVADWRGQREREPNVNVCLDVDSERLLEMYRQRLMEARA
jgi:inosine-uridine nucleoside N-ribohydrolase